MDGVGGQNRRRCRTQRNDPGRTYGAERVSQGLGICCTRACSLEACFGVDVCERVRMRAHGRTPR